MDAKRKAIPKSIRMTVYQKCDGHCAYCGCDLEYKDMQVDHVVPLNGWSEHGTDTVDNMLPACRRCRKCHCPSGENDTERRLPPCLIL